MGIIPKPKTPQWSLKKYAAVGIVGLEAIGFMAATERTLNVNEAVGRGIWSGVEILADKGLEPVACGALAITPWVEFDGDCIQNIGEEDAIATTPTGPVGSVPVTSEVPVPQVTQAPGAEPSVSFDADHNLYQLMLNAGYSCDLPHVVTASEGQGYVDLLQNPGDVGRATPETVVIDAYNNNVFNGLPVLMVGETAIVGACE